MKRPVISVCMVAYNHSIYVERAVASVLEQVCDADIKIIIGVDLSADNTLEKVESLQKRHSNIKCIGHEQRVGSGSRNYQLVIEQAHGDYIAHLDCDDFWLPGKLQAQLRFLEGHPDYLAVCSNARVVDAQGNTLGLFTTDQPARLDAAYLLERGNFLPHCSLFYRSSGQDLILGLQAPWIDYEIYVGMAAGNLGFINRVYAAYTYNAPESVRVTDNDLIRQRYWRGLNLLVEMVPDQTVVLQGKAEFLRSVAFRSVRVMNYRLWLRWWRKVSATEPGMRGRLALLVSAAVVRRLYLVLRGNLRSLGLIPGERVFYER